MVIPPWIKPADPAAHMAQGMHIGIQIGAQQAEERFKQQQLAARQAQADQEMSAQEAAQRFKEVQAAKNEQMAARDQSLAEQKFSLAASSAAQKHQAMQEYQSAVTGGMDPNEAMLKWGPAMSANTGAAAAIRAHERESRAPMMPQEITLPSGLKGVVTGQRFQYEPKAGGGQAAKVPEGAVYDPGGEGVPPSWRLPAKATPDISASERAQTLVALRNQRKDLVENQAADLIERKASRGIKLTEEEKKVLGELKDIADQEKALLPRLGKAGGSPTTAPGASQGNPDSSTPPAAQKIGRFTVMPGGVAAAAAPAAQAGVSAGDVPPPMVRGPVRMPMPSPASAQVPIPPPQAAAPAGPQYSYSPAQQVAMGAQPAITAPEPVTRESQIKQARQIAEKLPEDKLIETASHTVGDKVEKLSGGRFRVWNGDAKQDVTRKQLERMIAEQ